MCGFSQKAQIASWSPADARIPQVDRRSNQTMASGMNNGDPPPMSENVQEERRFYDSPPSSGSGSSGAPAFLGEIDRDSSSATTLLESSFIELDVRVVTATHTNESPSYGPCSATVIVPLDIRYDDLKQTCSHALKRESRDRQWCKRWARPKDEVISLLNINCWDCSEKLQELYRVPRLTRECIEVFISGIVLWNPGNDSHFPMQTSMDSCSASQGQGRTVLWQDTYLPPRLPMELQPIPGRVRYEEQACSLCWYWVEVNVQDGAIV